MRDKGGGRGPFTGLSRGTMCAYDIQEGGRKEGRVGGREREGERGGASQNHAVTSYKTVQKLLALGSLPGSVSVVSSPGLSPPSPSSRLDLDASSGPS